MSDPAPNAITPQAAMRAVPYRTARAEAAIARAAQATGTDFSYLLAQARIESGLNPAARARTSSASGLFQFIDQTWLATLDRHGERLGLGHLAAAIETSGGRAHVADPLVRSEILALRHDPEIASLMAGALAGDNRSALKPVLGREPDAAELYLAHFLGADGSIRLLSALRQNPDTSAAALLPHAARANRAIFFDNAGAPRSVAGVMELVRQKVAQAMGQEGTPQTAVEGIPYYPTTARSVQDGGTTLRIPDPGPGHGRPSMAATLKHSFALAEAAAPAMPGQAHVRRAYSRLEAFGL